MTPYKLPRSSVAYQFILCSRQDTVVVLRKFNLYFPSIHSTLSSLLFFLVALTRNCHVTAFSLCIDIHSFLIDENICESRNVTIRFPCVLLLYLCFSSGHHIFLKSYSFLFLFLCYPSFGLSLSKWPLISYHIFSMLDRLVGLVVSMSDY